MLMDESPLRKERPGQGSRCYSGGHGVTPIVNQTVGDLIDPPIVFLTRHSHLAGRDQHLELVLVVDEPGLVTLSQIVGVDACSAARPTH